MGAGKFTDDKGTTQSSYTIGGVAALTAVDAIATREGLTLSKTATYTLQIAAGRCVVLSAGGSRDIAILSSVITKVINVSWAVGTGNGGLDTGTISSPQTYHIYLIKRSDTGVVDAIASTSATAPTLPTNYTHYRRIGSVLTRSSAILDFDQYGDVFKWRSEQRDLNGYSVATAGELIALTVPTGIQVEALGTLSPGGPTTAGALGIYVSDPGQTDYTPTNGDPRANGFDATAGAANYNTYEYISHAETVARITDTSGRLRFRRVGSYASSSFQTTWRTQGYRDISLDVAGGSAGGGGGGSGDVVGPSGATDNAIARFDTGTGKLLQNSSATVDDSGNLTANSAKVASVANASAIAAGTIGAGGIQFVNNALPHGSAVISDGTTNKILVVDDLITATPSAASVTTSQNNYSIGTAQNVYINIGANVLEFTGFTATGQTHGRRFRLHVQISGGFFQVIAESGSSTAANRIVLPGDIGNYYTSRTTTIDFIYDGNASRWRVLSTPVGDGYAYFLQGLGAGSITLDGRIVFHNLTVATLPTSGNITNEYRYATDLRWTGGTGGLVRWNGSAWIDPDGRVATASGVVPSSFRPIELPANSGYAPSSNPARPDARTQQPVLAFDGTTAWFWEWITRLPESYNGNGLAVDILWTAAGSGNCVWNAAFSRIQVGVTNLNNAPTYATAQAVTTAAPGANPLATLSTITFTNSQIDGALAGEPVKFRLSRDAANGSDTLAQEAQVFQVAVRGV